MKRLLTILLCLSLMFVLVGCGNNGSGVADEEQDTEEVVDEVEGKDETAESEEYTVGSTFEAAGISLTLNSATYYKGDGTNTPPDGSQYVLLNFTIKNNNDEDYETSDIEFSTVIDGVSADTLKISPDYLDAVTLPPDSDTAGDLDYEVMDGWTDIQTEVKIGDVNSQTATFVITPDQVTE